MKKSILNLGKALKEAEQKVIKGGTNRDCKPTCLAYEPDPTLPKYICLCP